MSKRASAPADRPATVAEALDRAAQALRAQRLEEAERLAGDVLKANRTSVAAAQLLGQALLLQGRAQAALDLLARAARRSEDPAIETLLARALTEAGRGEAALERLAAATTRRPAYPLAFLELGDQLGRLGRFDDAQAVFEAGLALSPDAQVLRLGLGYLCLRRNDRPRARALFEAVRTAAPERHDARVALAAVLALDGDYAAAAGLYRLALDLRPDDAAAWIGLGKCLLELGDRASGEAALRAAARGGGHAAGSAVSALAATAHGRFFLSPRAAARFLGVGSGDSPPSAIHQNGR